MEPSKPGAALGGKMINLRAGGSLVRGVVFLGLGLMAAAVAAMGLGLEGVPAAAVHAPDGTVSLLVPVPVLAVTVASMVIAWTWLLVGALRLPRLFRIPTVVIFFLMHLLLTALPPSLGAGHWAVLAFCLGYIVWHGRAERPRYWPDLLVLGGAVALIYVRLILQLQQFSAGGEYVATVVSLHMLLLSLLVTPLLVVIGVDLGEMGHTAAAWLVGQTTARLRAQTLARAALILVLVKLALLLAWRGAGWSWLLGAAFVLLAWQTVRAAGPGEELADEPPFRLLLAVAGGMVALDFVLIVANMVLGGPLDSGTLPLASQLLPGLVAGAAALVCFRGRRAPARRTAAAYLAILALWAFTRLLSDPLLWQALAGAGGPGPVGVTSLDGGVAALLAAGLLYLAARRALTGQLAGWAIALTLGMSVLLTVAWMADPAGSDPNLPGAAQLALLGLGLGWEALTSGSRWTNGDSPDMPRPARVMFYFGSLVLTATALLYWKSTGQEFHLDDQLMDTLGFFVLGIPAFLYGFVRSGAMLARGAGPDGGVIGS